MKQSILTGVLISAFLIVLLSFINFAAVYQATTPSQFTTLTSTSVNFSLVFNNTRNGETYFNVVLYNSSDSSSSRAYQRLSSINVSNSSMSNMSVTMVDETRVWFYFNVTNITGGAVLSDIRIFDIDTKFLIFRFGGLDTINFSIANGDINTSGGLRLGKNITLFDGTNYRVCGLNGTKIEFVCT